MYFVLQTPSLQHIALLKIVAEAWNDIWNRHILTQAAQSLNGVSLFVLTEYSAEFKEANKAVKNKISALPLPDPCKTQLLNLIAPLGWEINNWCKYHGGKRHEYRFLQNTLPRQFRWTLHGVIDYAKTAELMVKDESVDVLKRFELACINCLKDEARQLFEIMSRERMQAYVDTLVDVLGFELYHLIVFFARTLRGVDRRLLNWCFPAIEKIPLEPSLKNQVFQDTLCSGNRRMCEYVFKKLNQRQKDRVLADCARLVSLCEDCDSSNLLYYLSLMNEEQQEHMFRTCISDLLEGLLLWPMQSLFIETVKCGWQFLTKRACVDVLFCIAIKIRLDFFKDYDYCQLFREFWRLSPVEHKQFYLEDMRILFSLLFTKREEFIQLLLTEASSPQMEIFFHKSSRLLMDEEEISDAALMECKKIVELISSNDEENEEKRLRSQRLSRLIDTAIENRIKSRENVVMYMSLISDI